jgi:hypothetical protein
MATKEELLAKRAAREAKLAVEQEAHELLCLELEDKYSTELGVRGRAWQMVNEQNDGGVGPIVLKPASLVSQKSYMQNDARGTPEVAGQFVIACVVYPSPEVATAIFHGPTNPRMQLLLRCAIAVQELSGYRDESAAKK